MSVVNIEITQGCQLHIDEMLVCAGLIVVVVLGDHSYSMMLCLYEYEPFYFTS